MFEEKTYKKCMCKGPQWHRRGKLKGKPVLDEEGVQKTGYLGTGCPRLSERNHGTWHFFLELPAGPDGKRQRFRPGGFPTQKKAAAECKKLWKQHQDGLDVGVREATGDFLVRWITGKKDIALGTANKYREHIDLHIAPYVGLVDRKNLRKAHIEGMFASIADRNTEIELHRDYVDLLTADCERKRVAWREGSKADRPVLRAAWMEARELLASERKKKRRVTGPTTQHRILATLRSALADAVLAEEVSKNWAELVTLPKVKAPKPLLWTPARVAHWRATGEIPGKVMVWTPQLLGEFLDTYVDDELFDLWHFMALRGPRRGETCALPWSEVDLDQMQVTISQQLVYIASQLYQTAPKADSERTINLDSESARLLADRRDRQTVQRKKAGPAWKETGLVFTKENGEAYHPDYLTYRFAKLVEQAKLPPITLHGLRHGAACIAHYGGADMKDISDQLGHSGIQITADTYTNTLEEAKQAQAEAALAVVPRAGRPTPEPAPAPTPVEAPAPAPVPVLAPTGGRLTALRRAQQKKLAAKTAELVPA
ncbi:tyrosine recombinase XerC [Kitasatospora sp. NPDC092286]|uniref:site-specific integrase n=1 Tax=Kitasatospora sp. NPDC092286 TaxID=3364087 RepID=UPI003811FA54